MAVFTTLFGVGLAFLAGVVYYSQDSQLDQIKGSFKQKVEFKPPECFIPSTMIGYFKEGLQHTSGVYHLVEGPHGSGKSTALQYAAAAGS